MTVSTLDTIIAWYNAAPPRVKQALSLENLHNLQKAIDGWNFDMAAAPKDGTLLQLLIAHNEDEGTECDGGFENEETTRVMGFNNGADDGEDVWKFPGWDWCQDCIVEQGCGKPIAWKPFAPRPKVIA